MRPFVIDNQVICKIVEDIIRSTYYGWFTIREIRLDNIFINNNYQVKNGILKKNIIPFLVYKDILMTKQTSIGIAYKANTLNVKYDTIPEDFLDYIKTNSNRENINLVANKQKELDLNDVAYILNEGVITEINIKYIEKEILEDGTISIRYKGVSKSNKYYMATDKTLFRTPNDIVDYLLNNIQ